ncbi:hypothetical protein [Leyella stercorea]
MRTSAPTDADVCADRCGHLRRPIRTSAPTDADIRADRYARLRRSVRIVLTQDKSHHTLP